MDYLLSKIYSENETDFFEDLYESSEDNGRIYTNNFKEKIKTFEDEKNISREKLNDIIEDICKDDTKNNDKIQESLKEYLENIEKENVQYIKQYYRQRNEGYNKMFT